MRVLRDLLAALVILPLLVAGAFTLWPGRPPVNLPPPGTVLDMHTHVAALGRGCAGCFVAPELTDSYKFSWYLRAFGTDAHEMAARGDVAVAEHLREQVRNSRFVARAVVLALDGVIDDRGELDRAHTQIYVTNDYVRDLARRFPEFVYGASINPYRRDALARLDQAKRDGAVLVKWIPAIMRIDPADPALDAFYERLVALDLPLLIHVGDENAFHHADNALGDPARLLRPLEHGVRVIAAHLATTGDNGGEENFTRLLPLFARYPRLLSEESSLTQVNKLGYLTRGLAHGGVAERLLHGSDWPLQFFPLVWAWWQAPRAPWAELRYAAGLDSPLDRDIAIKAALGTPVAVFTRTASVLGVDLETAE
ncbi:MAG: amidohydrolase family protein [Gammaproteobacteria bacterium]|nr:amidohydrolase family protein [Gammaproteobacteria bacterium]MCP5201673.1 amidohydrolase family protein [Gammaproteobacteria bacterium]